jgi:hypothetical protein
MKDYALYKFNHNSELTCFPSLVNKKVESRNKDPFLNYELKALCIFNRYKKSTLIRCLFTSYVNSVISILMW